MCHVLIADLMHGAGRIAERGSYFARTQELSAENYDPAASLVYRTGPLFHSKEWATNANKPSLKSLGGHRRIFKPPNVRACPAHVTRFFSAVILRTRALPVMARRPRIRIATAVLWALLVCGLVGPGQTAPAPTHLGHLTCGQPAEAAWAALAQRQAEAAGATYTEAAAAGTSTCACPIAARICQTPPLSAMFAYHRSCAHFPRRPRLGCHWRGSRRAYRRRRHGCA